MASPSYHSVMHYTDDLQLIAFLEAAPLAFGRHLAALRKVKGWSQERLALESGMARSYLGGIERGHRNVSFKNIMKLAQTMQIPPPLLLNFNVDQAVVSLKMRALMESCSLSGDHEPSASVPELSRRSEKRDVEKGQVAKGKAETNAKKTGSKRMISGAANSKKESATLHEPDTPYDDAD